jgi:hypothetical protein
MGYGGTILIPRSPHGEYESVGQLKYIPSIEIIIGLNPV